MALTQLSQKNRKQKNEKHYKIFHHKNMNICNFYAIMMKTDFRNMSESRRFRRKNRAKQSRSSHFATFFLRKTAVFVEKRKTLVDFMH